MDRIEEKEIIEKALKYDVLLRTIISTIRLNYSKDDLTIDRDDIILYMLKSLEENKYEGKLKELKDMEVKNNG